MHRVRSVQKLCDLDLAKGLTGTEPSSWHYDYRKSACVYIGGLDERLSEGDVLTVVSQWGEVVDMRLVRDRETGKSRGFAFVVFEDQRSTILCVDNLNGAELLDRSISVDHADYKPPEPSSDSEDETYPQYLKRKQSERLKHLLEGANIAREERKQAKKRDREQEALQLEAKRLRLEVMEQEARIAEAKQRGAESESSEAEPRRRDDGRGDSKRRRRRRRPSSEDSRGEGRSSGRRREEHQRERRRRRASSDDGSSDGRRERRRRR